MTEQTTRTKWCPNCGKLMRNYSEGWICRCGELIKREKESEVE